MLKFTTAQEQAILANRRSYNAAQDSMAERFNISNTSGLVGNAYALPKDVWGQWDREAVTVQRRVMAIFNDLAKSLSTPMPIGKLITYFQTVTDSGDVNVSLDGRSKARTDRPTFDYHGTPMPIIDSVFGYGWRDVEAARSEGFNLDATGRDNAFDKIATQLEAAALDGYPSITVDGNSSYGLRTHPMRNTRSTGVALNGASGADIVTEFVATLKLLHGDNFKVPATIYMNWDDWFYVSVTEFTAGYPKKILAAVMEIAGIKEIIPSDTIAANELIAVVKDKRVINVLNAMPLTVRAKFRANPEDDYDFIAMAAASIQIKFDAEENCGIAHSA